MKLPHIIGPEMIVVAFPNHGTKTITKNHHNFAVVTKKISENLWEQITVGLFDVVAGVNEKTASEDIHVDRDGKIYVAGEPLKNSEKLTERIKWMMKSNVDVTHFVNFVKRCVANPNKFAVAELFGFLEKNNLPITEEGFFVAFKKINSDFKDFYTGKIDNSVGAVVEMKREVVDANRNNTCSTGLHFCSESYLSHYYGGQGITVKVLIDPADVISIPIDYNLAKGRCCKYVVLEVVGAGAKGEKIAADIEKKNELVSKVKTIDGINDSSVRTSVHEFRKIVRSRKTVDSSTAKHILALTNGEWSTVVKHVKNLLAHEIEIIKPEKVGEPAKFTWKGK